MLSKNNYHLRIHNPLFVKLSFAIVFFWVGMTVSYSQQMSLLQDIRQDSALDIAITLDWKALEKKKKEKNYHSAHVRFILGNRDTLSIPAQVRTRGNMRLQICSLPPLKLKFTKSDLTRHGYSPMNEMDLVLPCHEGELYQQYILKEYLAYKLWELISPFHFKTQLVDIQYTQLLGSEAHDPSTGFLVENTEEVVERLGGRKNKTAIISQNSVDKTPMLSVALFQFMIGNTDWFIQNRHNLEFVVVPGHSLLVPIPYDFDYSGLVGANYAVHHESLELATINTRYYQGKCYSADEVEEALKVFLEKKEQILSLPYRIHGLSERSAKEARTYLTGFYDIIENPKKLENQVIKHCGMWPVED